MTPNLNSNTITYHLPKPHVLTKAKMNFLIMNYLKQ